MSADVSPELSSKFDDHSDDPAHKEAVLVTSEQPIEREALAAAGLNVSFVSSDGTISAGSLDRTSLSQLADVPGILLIEPDGEMRALDN